MLKAGARKYRWGHLGRVTGKGPHHATCTTRQKRGRKPKTVQKKVAGGYRQPGTLRSGAKPKQNLQTSGIEGARRRLDYGTGLKRVREVPTGDRPTKLFPVRKQKKFEEGGFKGVFKNKNTEIILKEGRVRKSS